MTNRKEAAVRFTAKELRQSQLDRVIAAETESARLRRENEFLRERVAQLEAREDRLQARLGHRCASCPLR